MPKTHPHPRAHSPALTAEPAAKKQKTAGLTQALLEELPKTDLHVHLDGSIRIGTLMELASQQGVELPADSIEGMMNKVYKSSYADLVEYLAGFKYATAVMSNRGALERVAYEFAEDNFKEGVRYFEVRFGPQLHASPEMSIKDAVLAVNRGCSRARNQFNLQATEKGEPLYEYGIIACAMRSFDADTSPYFSSLHAAHEGKTKEEICGIASLELVQALVDLKHDGAPVVAVDIAGGEAGAPARVHKDAFDLAHHHFLSATAHGGEAWGPESIKQAVLNLGASRIGHGTNLYNAHMVVDPGNGGKNSTELAQAQREAYVQDLVRQVGLRRTTFEVCPTSNLQTMPELAQTGLGAHAAKRMIEENIQVSICTDNRLVSSTSVVQELVKVIEAFDLSPVQLRRVVLCGFKSSFYPGSWSCKRDYLRQIMDFYDTVAQRHGVVSK